MEEKENVALDHAPTNGQHALDNSVSVSSSPPYSRIGVDLDGGEMVVFEQTGPRSHHGYVRTWNQLTQVMKDALMDNGLIDEQGRIILRDKRGNIIGYGKDVINE